MLSALTWYILGSYMSIFTLRPKISIYSEKFTKIVNVIYCAEDC